MDKTSLHHRKKDKLTSHETGPSYIEDKSSTYVQGYSMQKKAVIPSTDGAIPKSFWLVW